MTTDMRSPFEHLCVALGGPEFPAVIALVGGGGKTTTLFGLTRHLRSLGHTVATTTTTKMGASQTGGLHKVPTQIDDVLAGIAEHGAVISVGEVHGHGDRPKVGGLSDTAITTLAGSGKVDAIIIEADGSRRHNVKAPAEHEPVIPRSTTHVIAVIGADALGEVIEEHAHRPLLVAAAAGCRPGERLTPELAARLLTSDIGSRKSEPSAATFTVVMTKVTPENQADADDVAQRVRAQGFAVVLFPFSS